MADRKQTPDIIGELMGPKGQHDGINLKASRPVRQRTGIPVKQQASKPAVKATFYLSPGAIESLEQLWMKRRQQAEPRLRGRISKSLLVEEAIGLLGKK